MGVRFCKDIRRGPSLHLNLSGSGLNLIAGPRGASMTFALGLFAIRREITKTGLFKAVIPFDEPVGGTA